MPTAIKSPKFLLFWLSLLLMLLPLSTNLQASFAPPIEPAQYQANPQPAKTKKAKQKAGPHRQDNPRVKRFLGGLAIALFGAWFTGLIFYGGLWAFIAAIFGAFSFAFFFWMIALVLLSAGIAALPGIIYGAIVVDNSYFSQSDYTPSLWPRLRREYGWGMAVSLLYGLGAIALLMMSYAAGASPVAVAIFALVLVASVLVFLHNIKNYNRHKPNSRNQRPNTNPDEYN